jgi:hypothetical protein
MFAACRDAAVVEAKEEKAFLFITGKSTYFITDT